MELKLAGNWTGPELFERLRNQLCGDYLRDPRSNLGLFVLVKHDEKARWQLPGSNKQVDFEALILALQNHWSELSESHPHVEDVKIVGIDLTARSRRKNLKPNG
jgi:hypothetical protein